MPMPYKISSFEVITLKLRKVTCIVEGKECQGLIKDDGPSTTGIGHYVCTSSCKITIDHNQYLVLWELCRILNNLTVQSMAESWNGTADQTNRSHNLPFKVMGSCFDKPRQNALEEAFEYLYDYNRNVFCQARGRS